jgi:hypothetical protein
MAAIATLRTAIPTTDTTQSTQVVRGTIAFTGSAPASPAADTLALNLYGVQSDLIPIRVDIFEYPPVGTPPTGYTFVYQFGTGPADGAIVVEQGGAAVSNPSAPIPAGAYPAALVTASAAGYIQFQAEFALGN